MSNKTLAFEPYWSGGNSLPLTETGIAPYNGNTFEQYYNKDQGQLNYNRQLHNVVTIIGDEGFADANEDGAVKLSGENGILVRALKRKSNVLSIINQTSITPYVVNSDLNSFAPFNTFQEVTRAIIDGDDRPPSRSHSRDKRRSRSRSHSRDKRRSRSRSHSRDKRRSRSHSRGRTVYRPFRDKWRQTQNAGTSSMAVFLPGTYRLTEDLNNTITMTFVGRDAPIPTPNTDVILEGSATSGGFKSFERISFQNGEYTLNALADNATDTFSNCNIGQNFQFKISNGGIIFKNCEFNINKLDYNAIVVQDKGYVVFDGCNVNIQTHKSDDSFIIFKSCSNTHSTIANTNFDIESISANECDSKPFIVIRIESQQPIEFTNNNVSVSAQLGETIIFGSAAPKDSITLNIIKNTFAGLDRTELRTICISNLWSIPAFKTPFSSIYLGENIFRQFRILSYSEPICLHDRTCNRETNCDHRNASDGWDQSITIENTAIYLFSDSPSNVSSVLRISERPSSTWFLFLKNVTINTNNSVIPIFVSNIGNIDIWIINSTFINSTNNNQANQITWAQLQDINVANILFTPSSSTINFAPLNQVNVNSLSLLQSTPIS